MTTLQENSTLTSMSRKESVGCMEMKRNGIDPLKEHFRVKQNLDFPMNPAFLKVNVNDRRQL